MERGEGGRREGGEGGREGGERGREGGRGKEKEEIGR